MGGASESPQGRCDCSLCPDGFGGQICVSWADSLPGVNPLHSAPCGAKHTERDMLAPLSPPSPADHGPLIPHHQTRKDRTTAS